jgi:hypothetical protein
MEVTMTTKAKPKTVWERLSQIDVNEHTEKKGNLTYLSWAWAWGTLKNEYPSASFHKHFFDHITKDGEVLREMKLPYAIDEGGNAYVRVSVKVEDEEVTETLPVLSGNNRPVKNPDSFAVNTSLQRCLAKAIAYHGLGHYIYAGEDTAPIEAIEADEPEAPPKATPKAVPKATPKAVPKAAAPTVVPKSNGGAPADVTVDEWRAGFLDHPEGVVTPEGTEHLVAGGMNDEGWKLAAKVFETFMPRSTDYSSPNECVKGVNNFWRINKKVLTDMSKAEPALHAEVMAGFKAAKIQAQGE